MVPMLFLALAASILLLRLSVVSGGRSNVYIVYMGDEKHEDPQLAREIHHGIVSHVLGSKEEAASSILYSYKHGFSGFAAVLTKSQAGHISGIPGVVRVVRNRILDLHTTRSWDFLHLSSTPVGRHIPRTKSGNGVIIGVLDTGIWPESESFVDEGMSKVPGRWKGVCQTGQNFTESNCNRKLIGARWYMMSPIREGYSPSVKVKYQYIKGYTAELGKLNTSGATVEFLSPRDASGHGTHTSSTAAGSFVEGASFMGLARGLARGGASSAHLAIYKVCWATGGCSTADVLAAFDDSIHDGVDVLSVSLGSSPPLPIYVEDVLAIGSFHAVARGIAVVCSGGNSGPYSQTVINTAPWILTVAASTIDRAFPLVITLGNNHTLLGHGLLHAGEHVDVFHHFVYGEDIASTGDEEANARGCKKGSLNSTLVKGNIVLCFQTRSQRSVLVASKAVAKAHGAGVIFAQFPTKDVPIPLGIRSITVDFEIGTALLDYIGITRNPVVKFGSTKTVVGGLVSPEVAYFSSRGPSSISPSILKPDVAAPGVNILASWSPVSSSSSTYGSFKFKLDSGTSMACPHISAIAAIVKSVHPEWSPAAVKSAVITTASVRDEYGQNLVAEGAPYKQGDPFDYGGGHVDPNKAIDPGLIFDMNIKDHVQFLCSLGYNNSAISHMSRHPTVCTDASEDLNLPSILIPELRSSTAVSRTVTNVGGVNSVYHAHVESPAGVRVQVLPAVLKFNSTVKERRFRAVFRPRLKVHGRYSFGSLVWEDGEHVVRIPLIVRTVMNNFVF